MSCKLFCTGRVGKVDSRVTATGKEHVSFSVASDTNRKGADGKYLTEWTNFDAWGAQAEYIKNNWNKGDVVEVIADKFTTQKDGKYYTNYTAREVSRLAKGQNSQQSAGAAPSAANNVDIVDEEIPF